MNPLFSRVLVTGCGGDIGLNILRLLRENRWVETLYSSDLTDDHPGTLFAHHTTRLPRADDPAYLSALSDYCHQEGIELVIPTSEPELRHLTDAGLDTLGKTRLLMANHNARFLGFDKLATAETLRDARLGAPRTESGAFPSFYPAILKPRFGAGAKNVQIVRTEEEARFFGQRLSDGIWQELLTPAREEYTCALYRIRSGALRTLTLRRTLAGGVSKKGVVVRDEAIDALLAHIATLLDLSGSINVQLIQTPEGPKVFEINPRFSSTVALRHKMGFADLFWSLQEAAGEDVAAYTPPPKGTRFYRVDQEVII